MATIHGARAAAAKLEIMDSFAFDDISSFLASDCVSDNSRHNHSPFSAVRIFSFSPLPSVRRRRNGTAHFSRMEFFIPPCLLAPGLMKASPIHFDSQHGLLIHLIEQQKIHMGQRIADILAFFLCQWLTSTVLCL